MIHNWTVNYRGLGFRDIGWLLWLDCSNAALHIGQRNGSKYCCRHWFQTGLSWITAYFCPSFCPSEPAIDMHRFNYTIKIRVAGAGQVGVNYFWFEIPLWCCHSTANRCRDVDLYIFHIFCQSANNGVQISTLTAAIALEWFLFLRISIICIVAIYCCTEEGHS